MKKQGRFLALGLAVLLCVLPCGCGGGHADTDVMTAPNTNPTPTMQVDVPAAAAAAGMTRLAFADDFDSYDTIDFSGKGKPGYNWYVDRPYNGVTFTREELQIQDGILHFVPEECGASIGLPTYSKKGRTGYAWHFGYAEIRMRFRTDNITLSSEGRDGTPAFWGVSVVDVVGEPWDRVGEIDIFEAIPEDDTSHQSPVLYTGTLHDHVKQADGTKKIATNLANATGALGLRDYVDDGWHTYAALWQEGYVAWYFDGELMHSARYAEGELPQYYYRDIDEPLARVEDRNPKLSDRTFPGAHTIMNTDRMVMFLGAHKTWPIDVDWVRIWETPEK